MGRDNGLLSGACMGPNGLTPAFAEDLLDTPACACQVKLIISHLIRFLIAALIMKTT